MPDDTYITRLTERVIIAVYKGAGEQNMSAKIRRVPGQVAGFSHLVLHCVHFLPRGVAGDAGGWSPDYKIWEVNRNFN